MDKMWIVKKGLAVSWIEVWKEDVKSQTNTYASLIVVEVVHVRKQRLVAAAWSRQYGDLFLPVTMPVCCTPNP